MQKEELQSIKRHDTIQSSSSKFDRRLRYEEQVCLKMYSSKFTCLATNGIESLYISILGVLFNYLNRVKKFVY